MNRILQLLALAVAVGLAGCANLHVEALSDDQTLLRLALDKRIISPFSTGAIDIQGAADRTTTEIRPDGTKIITTSSITFGRSARIDQSKQVEAFAIAGALIGAMAGSAGGTPGMAAGGGVGGALGAGLGAILPEGHRDAPAVEVTPTPHP